MKKIISSILCVLTVIVSVQGQTVGYYDFATPQAPFSSGFTARGLHVDPAGGYLVWGKASTSVVMVRLDQHNQVQWTRVMTGVNEIRGSVADFDSLWVFYAHYASNPDKGQVVVMDKTTGGILYRSRVEGLIGGLCKATDTTLVISGRIKTPSFYTLGFNQFPNDGFVTEMNLWGDTLWTNRIGVVNRSDDLLEVKRFGTGYFATGTLVPGIVSPTPPTNNNDVHLVMLNSSGGIVAKKQVDLLDAHPGGGAGGFPTETPTSAVVVDTIGYACYWILGTGGSYRSVVIAMGKSGGWLKTFAFGYQQWTGAHVAPFGMTKGLNGGVVLVGLDKTNGFVMKLSDTLDVEWATKVPGKVAQSVSQNSNGDGYVVLVRTDSPQHGFRLVHVDEFGNAGGPTCGNDTVQFSYKQWDVGTVSDPVLLQGNYPYQGFPLSPTATSTTMVTLQDSCMAPMVLPIELLDFSAKVEGERVLLEWVTASEQDNDYFEVLRGRDPWSINEVVGRVDGAGTSQETIRYQLYDDEPLVGTSYYQLRQVDYDFAGTYSKVVSVSFERARVLWPNPTRDLVHGLPRGLSVSVYDMTGRLVKRFVRSDGPINLSELVTGTYLLNMDDGRKYIIQKE